MWIQQEFKIKKLNTITSQILHSCDFAIVYNCEDGRQQYIRFNKDHKNYTWDQGKGFKYLENKINWLKANGNKSNLTRKDRVAIDDFIFSG